MSDSIDKSKLMAYVHGELEESEARAFTQLMIQDEQVRLEVESLIQASQALDSYYAVGTNESLNPEQLARIRRAASKPEPFWKPWMTFTSGMAVAGLAAVVFLQFAGPTSDEPKSETAAVEAPAPEASPPVGDIADIDREMELLKEEERADSAAQSDGEVAALADSSNKERFGTQGRGGGSGARLGGMAAKAKGKDMVAGSAVGSGKGATGYGSFATEGESPKRDEAPVELKKQVVAAQPEKAERKSVDEYEADASMAAESLNESIASVEQQKEMAAPPPPVAAAAPEYSDSADSLMADAPAASEMSMAESAPAQEPAAAPAKRAQMAKPGGAAKESAAGKKAKSDPANVQLLGVFNKKSDGGKSYSGYGNLEGDAGTSGWYKLAFKPGNTVVSPNLQKEWTLAYIKAQLDGNDTCVPIGVPYKRLSLIVEISRAGSFNSVKSEPPAAPEVLECLKARLQANPEAFKPTDKAPARVKIQLELQ